MFKFRRCFHSSPGPQPVSTSLLMLFLFFHFFLLFHIKENNLLQWKSYNMKINHFKVNSLTTFSIFTMLCNYPFCFQNSLQKLKQLLSLSLQNHWQPPISFLSMNLPKWNNALNEDTSKKSIKNRIKRWVSFGTKYLEIHE